MDLTRAALVLVAAWSLGCPPKSAPATPKDPRSACCTQCKDGAAQDPQGRDLALLDCGQYATSQACGTYFAEHPTFVQDCR